MTVEEILQKLKDNDRERDELTRELENLKNRDLDKAREFGKSLVGKWVKTIDCDSIVYWLSKRFKNADTSSYDGEPYITMYGNMVTKNNDENRITIGKDVEISIFQSDFETTEECTMEEITSLIENYTKNLF